jgi:hypothetical protein
MGRALTMRLAVPIFVLAGLAALAIWGALQRAGPQQLQPIPCANPVAGCTFVHHDAPAQLRFSATPEPLKPFFITLSHPSLKTATISFQMADMDMGFNRYDFTRGPPGVWTARIVLPVCTSSRVDWISEIHLDDRFYSLRFTSAH